MSNLEAIWKQLGTNLEGTWRQSGAKVPRSDQEAISEAKAGFSKKILQNHCVLLSTVGRLTIWCTSIQDERDPHQVVDVQISATVNKDMPQTCWQRNHTIAPYNQHHKNPSTQALIGEQVSKQGRITEHMASNKASNKATKQGCRQGQTSPHRAHSNMATNKPKTSSS
jgi:hypothetical protein